MKVTTKEYIETLLDASNKLRESDRRYFEAEISSIRRAVDKYSETNDERWVGANEFRSQLKDQAGTFLTRRELWLAAVAIIGIVLGIVRLFLK